MIFSAALNREVRAGDLLVSDLRSYAFELVRPVTVGVKNCEGAWCVKMIQGQGYFLDIDCTAYFMVGGCIESEYGPLGVLDEVESFELRTKLLHL